MSVDVCGDVAAFDRMESIREKFHSLEGGSQARSDYLTMVLDELNGLRRGFGLPPVRVNDPSAEVDPSPPTHEGSYPAGY